MRRWRSRQWEVSCLRVKIMNRVWEMSRRQFQGLLQMASEQVPFGVYAVEKGGYAELLNLKCTSKRQLKQAKREWNAQGFRVYVNGL